MLKLNKIYFCIPLLLFCIFKFRKGIGALGTDKIKEELEEFKFFIHHFDIDPLNLRRRIGALFVGVPSSLTSTPARVTAQREL